MDFEKLRAPFPPERISWRVGSTTQDKKKGMALAYIDARDVMQRLDAVCGPAGWQNSYPHANGKTVCRIEINVDGQWIGKEDGAGDSDVEAEKGALSDAFKRAAVRWGVGQYLYDVDSPWVEIEPMGRSFKISESAKPALVRALGGQKAAPPKQDAVIPVALPFKKGDWIPLTAKPFVSQFLDIARRLPSKETRQAHYKLNEPAIQDLRGVNRETAEYIDNKFAELV